MSVTDGPRLEDSIRLFVDSGIASLHAAIPAIVVVYDPILQRASCQPVVRKRMPNPLTGVLGPSVIPSPATPFLPVAWPSGGGAGGPPTWGHTGPLLPGDPVTLLVRSRSCDEWQGTGLADNVALDPRRWALQDAVVLPGARPNTVPLPPLAVDPISQVLYGTPASPLKLGSNLALEGVLKGATTLAALKVFVDAVLAGVGGAAVLPPTPVQNATALAAIGVAAAAFSLAIGTPAVSPLMSTTVKVAP